MQLHLDINRKKKVPKITVRKTELMKKFKFSKKKKLARNHPFGIYATGG